MNLSVKMVLVLTLITGASGAILAYWDKHTAPMIAENKLKELEQGIAAVLPPHDAYNSFTYQGKTYYQGTKEGQPIGICFPTDGPGFQGKITIMVGLKPDFNEITGIKVLEQIETPGLGTKIITDPSNKKDAEWFPRQFIGKLTEQALQVLKNQKPSTDYQIEAITGATISSKAVARIISQGVADHRAVFVANHPGQE